MPALIDKYSKEELEQIVQNSSSINEVADKLGYTTHSGSNNKTIKSRLEKYNISTEHFSHQTRLERNENNIFIKNSTASQQTLRRWYLKNEYTPYVCSICGQEPIWQGKDLTLILDHINGSNHDDRLENLRWVCPNCNQQLETTGFKKKNYTLERIDIFDENGNFISDKERAQFIPVEKSKKYCIDCGKEISSSATRCNDCENLHRRIPLGKMSVTREELKELIRSTPFTVIGSKFGVSDNTIRKWCEKFNLPKKSKEIKSISDENWINI